MTPFISLDFDGYRLGDVTDVIFIAYLHDLSDLDVVGLAALEAYFSEACSVLSYCVDVPGFA